MKNISQIPQKKIPYSALTNKIIYFDGVTLLIVQSSEHKIITLKKLKTYSLEFTIIRFVRPS